MSRLASINLTFTIPDFRTTLRRSDFVLLAFEFPRHFRSGRDAAVVTVHQNLLLTTKAEAERRQSYGSHRRPVSFLVVAHVSYVEVVMQQAAQK